jgi:peroxiredoxin
MILTEVAKDRVGKYSPDFELLGVDNQVHHLARYLEQFQAVGVVFIANQMPQIERYIHQLKLIQDEFGERGFALIAINSSDSEQILGESFEEMKKFALNYQLNFPYLRDRNQDVVKSFTTEVIPEAFAIDKTSIIRYRGKIQDSEENAYLKKSIIALLEEKEIETDFTKVEGTAILWRALEN